MQTVEHTSVPPELVSTICSNCDYALDGLAPDAVCPECGREQRPNEVVLYGWGRGWHEKGSNAKPSRFLWVLFCGNLWWVINSISYGGWIGKFCIAFGIVPLAWMLFRRRESLHQGMVQIRINSAGCVQYDNTSGRSMLQELMLCHGWILALCPIIVLTTWLLLYHTLNMLILFCTGSLAAAMIAFFAWNATESFRALRRALPDNAIMDGNAIYYPVTKWSAVNRFLLLRQKPGTYQLQILALDGRRAFGGGKNIVDANIELTDEKADLLRNLIYAWMGKPRVY